MSKEVITLDELRRKKALELSIKYGSIAPLTTAKQFEEYLKTGEIK